MPRCPATDSVTVDDEPLPLQCTHASTDPDGRHRGDHLVHLSPTLGGDHTWPNENPLPEPEPSE